VKTLRPVKENLPRSNHHRPAREDRAKCHKDHAQRPNVEHADKKIRRVPQRNKGERDESQKRDELDREADKYKEARPRGNQRRCAQEKWLCWGPRPPSATPLAK